MAGASYVIVSFQVGGVSAFELDYKIPLKYGVDQCIGDTLGPGGVFRALRSIPVILDVARDMEELCPNATLLNYVNPMAMVCWALGETNIQYVGLCHGVQTTLDLISGYVGVPKQEIDYVSAGINHMGWFTKLSHRGRDLYPELREKFEQPEFYVNEKVRGEVFRHFGYFMTESTGHLSGTSRGSAKTARRSTRTATNRPSAGSRERITIGVPTWPTNTKTRTF